MLRLGRNEISWDERVRRYTYYFLRDELDGLLIQEAMVESYRAFKAAGKEYPFVSMRELKPRAKMAAPEYAEQAHFIVIFVEDTLPPQSKKDIRIFDSNKVTKENLGHIAEFDLRELFHQKMRFFDDKNFSCLLKSLLQADYAPPHSAGIRRSRPGIGTHYRTSTFALTGRWRKRHRTWHTT